LASSVNDVRRSESSPLRVADRDAVGADQVTEVEREQALEVLVAELVDAAYSWIFPERSIRSRTPRPGPAVRRAAIRPATRCARSVCSSAASPACSESTAAICSTPSKS